MEKAVDELFLDLVIESDFNIHIGKDMNYYWKVKNHEEIWSFS